MSDIVTHVIRDLTTVHSNQGFLSKPEVRTRLESMIAEAVLLDRVQYRPNAIEHAKHELIEYLKSMVDPTQKDT